MLKRLWLCLVCLLAGLGVGAGVGVGVGVGVASAAEPLEPAQAFRLSVHALDAQTISVRWDIAPGYYMYRDKFTFAVEPGNLGAFELPPGTIKDDETFGRVETYRDQLELRLPVQAAGRVTLMVGSQGCADIGICYPPQKQRIVLELPAANATRHADTAPLEASTATPAAAATWQQRLQRPSLLGPALLGLLGVVLAAVPMRVRRGLWYKGAGFAIMFAAAILLLLLNSDESAAVSEASVQSQERELFTAVRNVADLDALLALSDKPVLLDFYADWCAPCREMEKDTFSDAAVRQRLAAFTLLRADVTANNAEHQALLKRFSLQGPPGIIMFDASGREWVDARLIGYRAPAAFLEHLNRIR